MYTGTTNSFNEILGGASRHFYCKFSREGEEITSGFRSVKITQQANPETDSFSIGGSVATVVEVQMDKPSSLLTGKEFQVSFGLEVDGKIEYCPVCVVTAEKPKEDDGLISFTAYDRMVSKLNYPYYTEITAYPVDAKVILREISNKTGVSIANLDSLPNGIKVNQIIAENEETGTTSKKDPFSGCTYRQAVKYIAQLYGTFATMNRVGELEFRWYTQTDYTVELNRSLNDIVVNEEEYEVQRIVCASSIVSSTYSTGMILHKYNSPVQQDSDGILSVGIGTTGITMENPVMTFDVMESLWEKLQGFKFTPVTVSFLGDCRLDLGDIITIKTRSGSVNLPIMGLMLEFDGGLTAEVGSYGSTEMQEASAMTTPTDRTVDYVNSRLLFVNELLANKVNTDYLKANYATIKELDAVEARIDKIVSTDITTEYLEANYATIESVKANYATIDLANVDIASIEKGFLKELLVEQGLLADRIISPEVTVTDCLTGVSILANDIVAGRLDAAEIEVVNMNCANLTVGQINGQQIASGAIDMDKLAEELAGTITQTVEDVELALKNAGLAQTAAGNAQTTADGKNTVFYQASAPSVTGRKTNDIWFDTDDGNKMYCFNGTSWAAAQFGTNAIASASITNALIADATIQSAKIASLDAAKITTGTLNAARIASLSITTDKLAANAVTVAKLDVDGIFADSAVINKIATNSIVIGSMQDAIIPFITGTQTAATGTWTGTAPFTELKDGQQITYWLPYAGSGNATLNLTLSDGTTTGAKNVYYGGITRLTTHYPAGSAIRLIYRSNASINGSTYTGWWADANYDSNSVDRQRYQSAIKAKSAISSGKLIVGDSSGYFNLTAGTGFDISKPILWAGSNIAAAATGTNNYTYYSYVNLQTTKSGWKGTQYAPVYLVGTLSGTTFTPNSTMFTTTVPTSADGLVYIMLGQLYSTYQCVFVTDHPMYKYIDGEFKSFGQIAADVAANWGYGGNTVYINGGKIYAGSVTANQIASRTLTADKIVAGAITANEIAASTITAEKIASNAVTAAKIASSAVISAKIAAGAVTADKISVTSLEAIVAKIGGFTINSTSLYNGTNSATSTTAGIYLGTNAIRAYKSATAYTHIENGVLTCVGANIKGDVYLDNALYMWKEDDDGEKYVRALYWGGTYSAANLHTDTTFEIGGGLVVTGDIERTSVNVSNIGTSSLPFGTVYTSNWFRSTGSTGWYNETYGGGIQMKDSDWVRVSHSKRFLVSNVLRADGEIQSTSANSYRQVQGNYGTFWRNDGSNLWLMFTSSGNQYGSYNNLRPMYFNLSNGNCTLGHDCSVAGSLSANGKITGKSGVYWGSERCVYGRENSVTWLNNLNGSYMEVYTSTGVYGVNWFASDARLKKNIEETTVTALNFINRINHKQFEWKQEGKTGVRCGYIAQQLEEAGLDVTYKIKQPEGSEIAELYQIDSTRLIPYLTKAIQELSAQIEELQNQIVTLQQGAV